MKVPSKNLDLFSSDAHNWLFCYSLLSMGVLPEIGYGELPAGGLIRRSIRASAIYLLGYNRLRLLQVWNSAGQSVKGYWPVLGSLRTNRYGWNTRHFYRYSASWHLVETASPKSGTICRSCIADRTIDYWNYGKEFYLIYVEQTAWVSDPDKKLTNFKLR